MNMFKGLLSGAGGPSEGGDPNLDGGEIFKQFGNFLENSEKEFGGDEFKGLLDSVVKDILSKDSLYKPMKILKDQFPDWLENNWENIS
jgi:peroxin-19